MEPPTLMVSSYIFRIDTNAWIEKGLRGSGSNLDLGIYRREILKPLSDLQTSLDIFPDRSAIAAHQLLIQASKPLSGRPLRKPAVPMQ
jgi:hypothetical protein